MSDTEPDSASSSMSTAASIAYLCGFFPAFVGGTVLMFQFPPVQSGIVRVVYGMADALQTSDPYIAVWLALMAIIIPLLVAVAFFAGMVGGAFAVRTYERLIDGDGDQSV